MHFPGTIISRLLGLIGAMLLITPFAQAGAQGVITNTASARWLTAGHSESIRSNTVTIPVAAIDIDIETLRYAPEGGGTISLQAPTCGGNPVVSTQAPAVTVLNGTLISSSELHIGEVLYARIALAAANRSPHSIDRIDVRFTSSAGDDEVVTVFETGPDTGEFLAAVPTIAVPPDPIPHDCHLSVRDGDEITVRVAETGIDIGTGQSGTVRVLADPYGIVFDSREGTAIDGVTITLVDASTGIPAKVFADDGISTWPSTVVTGQAVTDGSGHVHPIPSGEYRFPLAAFGTYRLVVTPPAHYSAPSTAPPAALSWIQRPDGIPVQISDGSYGKPFGLSSPAPVRVDIPLDPAAAPVTLTKIASRPRANPGDVVFFTILATNPDARYPLRDVMLADTPSASLRFIRKSVRIDGEARPSAVSFAADGSRMAIALGNLAPGQTVRITYAMTVRPDAPGGEATNRADLTDHEGAAASAQAVVRIEDEVITSRMTLIGRIAAGDCRASRSGPGIPGVRVTLEDGSFAITDADGRYHFEGLVPGTHVVQAAPETLPAGGRFVDCARSVRGAGKAGSRFVTGHGGSLAVADFAAIVPQSGPSPDAPAATEDPASDRAAAGAEIDWLALGDGPTQFLFPAVDHNPRAPAVRVVIRHRKGETVELKADGAAVDPVAFDGTMTAPGGHTVSIWRGIPLHDGTTRLSATVRGADGSVSASLARDVHFAGTPARIVLVPEKSRLVADGSTRPVVAFRVLDRAGRPVRSGITGEFALNQPYESAAALDAMQARALSGLDRAAPTWTVRGDDGVAWVELTPTMVSGPLHLDFTLTDGNITRRQTLESWIVPGAQKWTIVGLAEATAGSRSVADQMERTHGLRGPFGNKGRVAIYAKGRILGRYLLTAAYDSAKSKAEQPLLGAIDPRAYYTVFADGSNRRFDAAARKKLYVRIETAAFYAVYGDFVTGFDQTQLARYQRTLTGASAEGRFGKLHLQGFAARTGGTHRRDEIQGGGISGPYRLANRAIIAGSEIVRIEVRDRFRSEVIVDSTALTRFVDYDIDVMSGTITFRHPVLSRDAALNPQFVVIDYEVAGEGKGRVNAGARADLSLAEGRVRIGATAVTDTGASDNANDAARTDLAGIDAKILLAAQTELRAEAAMSRTDGAASKAWLVELEHRDGALDVLGYARSADPEFGLGQLNGAERGRRKIGLDGRYQVGDSLSFVASAWQDDGLADASARKAVQIGATWRSRETEARLGVAALRDRLRDGTRAGSTTIEGGVTRHLLDNRLELSGSASLALGQAESVDLPSRYRAGAAFAVTRSVKLVGTYEIARGKAVKAQTARAGLEVSPWEGARILGSMGRQDISEYGRRSFAALGLQQSLEVSKTLTVDASVDSSRTLGGIDARALVNTRHPASSGGNLGDAGTIAEDFTAFTLGGTWRKDRWSLTARGELRGGQAETRHGLTFGAIRQLGEGSMIGAGFTWTRAAERQGATSRVFDAAVSLAHRPAGSAIALLSRIELRSDAVSGGSDATATTSALFAAGGARSTRAIASVSANWAPGREPIRGPRGELGLFLAIRHNFDRYEGFDLKGTTVVTRLDARLNLGPRVELGAVATMRRSLGAGVTSFAVGPQIGISPATDTMLTIGYNIAGFRDRDFSAARSTDKGLFASVKMKFDADSLGFLGLRR